MQIKIKCPECEKQFIWDEKQLWKKAKCNNCYNIFTVESQEENMDKKNWIYKKNETFKPNKKSFILLHPIFIICLFIFIISFIIFISSSFESNFFSFLVITLILYFLLYIVYKKENYKIKDKQIVYNYWNIFSDNAIELEIDKIVQVSMELWFLQYHIFWTGNIIIQSAWSWNTNINIAHVNEPEKIYKSIQQVMTQNWFHLSKDKLVQEAKPHRLWVMFEIIWWSIWILYVIWNILFFMKENNVLAITLITIILILGFVSAIFKYLDLKRRNYRIYTDSIFFTEWFLSKYYSFLPFENVSDANNKQGFLSKIFWLHDITVSTQWSDNEVKFKNMVYWEKMMENIKYLKDKTILSESQKTEEKNTQENDNEDIGYKNTKEESLDYDKEFVWNYKMDIKKSMVDVFILIIILVIIGMFFPKAIWLLIIFIPIVIAKIIIIKFTNFTLKESSIEKRFSFLTNKHEMFSIEKVTKLDFKESLIDKLFWTCSIVFYSIWSGTNINFKNIKKTPNLYEEIKRKVGIKKQDILKEFDIDFNLKDYVKSEIITIPIVIISILAFAIIWTFQFYAIFGAIILTIIFVLRIIYLTFFYSPERYIQKIYSDVIESISGIIIQTYSYSLIRHIKWITCTKYPLTQTWSIKLNVAWEQVIQTNSWQHIISNIAWKQVIQTNDWQHIISNFIKISFVKNTIKKIDELDYILGKTDLNTETIKEDKPQPANIVVPIWLLLVLLLVGFIFNLSIIIFFNLSIILSIWVIILVISIFAFALWIIFIYIKVQKFKIEKSRIIHSYGIIYKTFHSIRHERIDFVESNQGFLNKIFKNWSVIVYTLWSSAKEMKIVNIKDYTNFYNILKKNK